MSGIWIEYEHIMSLNFADVVSRWISNGPRGSLEVPALAGQVLRESRGSVYEKCSGKLLCILDPNGRGHGENQRSKDVFFVRLWMVAFDTYFVGRIGRPFDIDVLVPEMFFLAVWELVHEYCGHCIHLSDRYTVLSESIAVCQVFLSSSSGTIQSEMRMTLTGKLL